MLRKISRLYVIIIFILGCKPDYKGVIKNEICKINEFRGRKELVFCDGTKYNAIFLSANIYNSLGVGDSIFKEQNSRDIILMKNSKYEKERIYGKIH